MKSELRMPDLPQGAKDGTIRRWLKAEGATVSAGEVLLELELERSIVEIESERDGVLEKIHAQKGATLTPGALLATLTGAAAAKDATKATKKEITEKAEAVAMGQVTPILMPKAGNDMEEGTVVKWLVKEGDAVKVGDVLFELETDKATMEIESEAAGTLRRIVVQEKQTVPILTPLAYLADSDADADAYISQSGEIRETEDPPAPPENVTPILMPKAGNDMEEGTVVKWLVKEGDAVKVGDVLFELETDKATMEIESEAAGTLRRIVVQEKQTVPILTPLAFLAESDADVDAYIAATKDFSAAAPAIEEKPAGKPAPADGPVATRTIASSDATGRVKASPAARRQAAERGIDLAQVRTGSGPGGRILSTDLQAIASGEAISAPPGARMAIEPVPGRLTNDIIRRPLSPMRKAIARNLTQSIQTAPHFYMMASVESVRLNEVYRRQKKICRASLNDLFVLAVARTMMSFPAFRQRLEGDEAVEFPGANIGVAVGTDDGLRVPVILDVDRMSLADLAAESRRVVTLAREGKPVNMGKGSFTISNLGMFGVEEFTAIINPPEAAILAVSAPRETVRVENGAIRATRELKMTLSSDHRLIDGMLAAKFMNRLKEILENPETLEA